MYCAYSQLGVGGPILTKTPNGLAFLCFSTEALASSFIAGENLSSPASPILVSELGSVLFPVPTQWAGIRDIVLIDSPETLSSFGTLRGDFPFTKHMGELPNASQSSR